MIFNPKMIALFVAPFIVALGVLYMVNPDVLTFWKSGTPNGAEQVAVDENREANYTINEVPEWVQKNIPSLDRVPQFSSTLPEEVRTSLMVQLNEAKTKLKEDNLNADVWFDLALVYHMGNDYDGAREVWEFLTKALPTNATAFDNLGKLYHYQLKDFAKSESYFFESRSVEPGSITPYLELHSLYRYSYKTDTTKAVDILREAMKLFPNELGLYVTLGGYYRDGGNMTQARAVFEEGLNKARDRGNVDMISVLGDELARLPVE